MKLIVNIKKALRGFTLDVNFTVNNEVFALLGGSGSGKSITLKCIAGIEKPDSGQIILNDRILFNSEQKINLAPQERRVGYLFQNYALFPNMTVAENILFAAIGEEADKMRRFKENIERFKLSGLENAYPAQLSGGQQQRVALARILLSNAEILLLDEPFSALDSYLKWQLELEMSEVFNEYGGTAILVSHDRGEVYRLSERVAVMNEGIIEAVDNKHNLFKNPQTLSSTLLTGCKNVSNATKIDDNHVLANDWQITLNIVNVTSAVKFIGLRAHYFEYRTTESENTFLMEVVQVIEDTFSFLIMVRRNSTAKVIRWEVDKKFWRSIESKTLYLYFPVDKLIIMEK